MPGELGGRHLEEYKQASRVCGAATFCSAQKRGEGSDNNTVNRGLRDDFGWLYIGPKTQHKVAGHYGATFLAAAGI